MALAVMTGCGKSDSPDKTNATKDVDTKVDTYEVKETESSFSSVGKADFSMKNSTTTYEAKETKIDFSIADNIPSYKVEEFKSLPKEKVDLVIEKQASLLLDLKKVFESKGIKVTINEANGDIALDSSILFDVDKSDISEKGKQFLSEFLPIYTSVILDEKYEGFISQIIVEGHTDTDGSYDYNMKLSQDRADKVKEFCKSEESGISEKYSKVFNSIVVSEGYSYDRPVTDSKGQVDMAASRRVSFRFLINID